MWAEVLDADAFTRFQREGIFNTGTGLDFAGAFWSEATATMPATALPAHSWARSDANALLERLGLLKAA